MSKSEQGKKPAAKPFQRSKSHEPPNLWAEAQRLTKEEFTFRYGAVGVRKARKQAEAAGAAFGYFQPKKRSVRTVSGGLPGLGRKN